MSITTSVGASISIAQVTEWIPKVINSLKPFKPEVKKMSINYKSRDSEISLALNIPDGMKRKFRKIEIPRYQNFEVSEMMDESFNEIYLKESLESDDKKIKIKCSNLPSSENYLLKLKGVVPQKALDSIVFIQPSINKDRSDDMDKYWLSSMIRDVETIEKLWDGLNVDDVTAGVNIGIDRYISAKLPTNIKEGLDALNMYAMAGAKGDRNKVLTAWKQRKTKGSKVKKDELFELFKTLTAKDFFSGFVDVEYPYNLGNIENKEILNTLPEDMYVEALTRLTLKEPTAESYMKFRKKEYVKCVEKKFQSL